MKKNVTAILWRASLFSALILFLFSCKKNVTSSQDPAGTDNSVYEYIKKLGYSDSDIKDEGDRYRVDGDIIFDKNASPDFSIFDKAKTEQYGGANYVGYNEQPFVSVHIEQAMQVYAPEINEAIALWNNVPNCRLKFNVVGLSVNARIRIQQASLQPGVCGEAYFPQNGLPGAFARFSPGLLSILSYSQRVSLFAHELGHAIGFRHTNWQNVEGVANWTDPAGAAVAAMHIMGTPTGDDPNSIMNGNSCGAAVTTLSAFDILAMQFLYPANPPVAGTVPVFRYYSRNVWRDHFYTTYFNEVGNGSNSDYIFEGIGFFAFPNQEANTVPVYRWYNSGDGDHFYTTSTEESSGASEGIAFYAYPSAINGSIPVHRYYHHEFRNHFYTKNQNELLWMPGYTYEGLGWYAY